MLAWLLGTQPGRTVVVLVAVAVLGVAVGAIGYEAGRRAQTQKDAAQLATYATSNVANAATIARLQHANDAWAARAAHAAAQREAVIRDANLRDAQNAAALARATKQLQEAIDADAQIDGWGAEPIGSNTYRELCRHVACSAHAKR